MYSRYEVKMEQYKDKIKITVIDNYFDKTDYAFCKKGAIVKKDTLTSYSTVAVSFVANVLEKFELIAEIKTLKSNGANPFDQTIIK